jgi:hypothetical protein
MPTEQLCQLLEQLIRENKGVGGGGGGAECN